LGITNTLRVPLPNARLGLLADPDSPTGFRQVNVNPASAIWLTAYPEVNSPRTFGPDIGEAVVATQEPTREDYFTVKMDYMLSRGDSLSARYTFDDSLKQTPSPTRMRNPAIIDNARNQYGSLEYNLIASPRVVNVLHFRVSRNHDGSAWRLSSLQPEFSLIPGKPLGQISVGGLSSVGVDTYRPNRWIGNVFDLNDTLTWTRGTHSFKIGGEFKRTQVQTTSDLHYSGQATFSSLEGFLTGTPQRFSGALPGSTSYRGFRRSYGAVFFQDDWEVFRNLALNLGLRWETMPAATEVNGLVSTLENVLTSTEFIVGNPWFFAHNTMKGFAPRIGFAWDPTGSGKSVLRGGFGVYASLTKRLTLARESRLEFRTEIFNVLNHPNFASPDLVPILSDGSYNPTAGVIGSTRETSRQIQLALRYVF
jgi:hypothetical protein